MTTGAVRGWPEQLTRVVFLAPRTPETSGGARVVHTLSVALEAGGVLVEHVSLRTGSGPPTFPTYVVDSRSDWHRRPSFRTTRGWRARSRGLVEVVAKRVHRSIDRVRLRRLLERYGPETVLVFTHVAAKVAVDESGYRRGDDGPVLVGQHHSQFESIDLEAWLRGAITRHFQDLDLFLALTEDDARKFRDILGPPCHTVPNPVPPSTVEPRARRPVAVSVGRLSPEKGLEVMIRCFAAATDGPGLEQWRLDIYGEGDQRERLQTTIQSLGDLDARRVRLAGHCDDVDEVLADASVLLMTSWMEGLPMSILEAAMLGVPTIAFDCSPGVRGLIGVDRGVLVPPEDEAAYTRALTSALRDRDALARMGVAAHRHARSFAPEAVLESWAALLAEALAPRRGQGRH